MYVYDNEGSLVFVVSYNAGTGEHTIRLARDPHMVLYLKNQNRELRIVCWNIFLPETLWNEDILLRPNLDHTSPDLVALLVTGAEMTSMAD